MSKKIKKVYFQTAKFTFIHPETGEDVIRNFVGQAVFTPEELARFKDIELVDVFKDIEMDKPYSPYDDPDNVEAHRALTDKVRDMMDGDIG